MKVNGNGQGKGLTPSELRLLFTDGLLEPRAKALFGICLFSGCRVSEALARKTTDIKGGTLTLRKSTTKGKLWLLARLAEGSISGALLFLTSILLFWRLYFSDGVFSASACRFNVVGDISKRRMIEVLLNPTLASKTL